MPRGYRHNIAAYIGGLILAFIAGVAVTALDYRGDYQERYPGYRDAPEEAKPLAPSGQSGMGAAQKKTPCANTQGREESDLCAQWRAANAAKQSARWSLWQLFLGIFGLIGLGLTLWFNKRLIDIALDSGADTETALAIAARNADAAHDANEISRQARKDAAEAAEEQNRLASLSSAAAMRAVEVAEKNAQQQLRAYVVPEAAWLEISEEGDVTAYVHAKNFGQTPAVDERHWISIWVESFPLDDDLPVPANPKTGSAVVGPGGHTEMRHPRPTPLNEASREAIIAGTAAIYVFGEISYSDIYGIRRKTEYVFFCNEAAAFEDGRLAHYHYGNTCE